jgi:hypothetical protein
MEDEVNVALRSVTVPDSVDNATRDQIFTIIKPLAKKLKGTNVFNSACSTIVN